jgi:Single-strand binding protein family
MNINRLIITGNLVADPTLRNTDSGTPVASATIANNEFYNDGEGQRQQVTTFVDVIVWGKPAENFKAREEGSKGGHRGPAKAQRLGIRGRSEAFRTLRPSREPAVHSIQKRLAISFPGEALCQK